MALPVAMAVQTSLQNDVAAAAEVQPTADAAPLLADGPAPELIPAPLSSDAALLKDCIVSAGGPDPARLTEAIQEAKAEDQRKKQEAHQSQEQKTPQELESSSGKKQRKPRPPPIHLVPSVHPIPCMQEVFEESMADSMEPPSPKRLTVRLDAEARRQQLLELDEFANQYSSRWQQKPGAKFHPLWKIIAQISFGLHLLHKRMAKSEHEVVKILQSHVDEIDAFVEDTLADFDLAAKDLDERLQSLLLALEHGRTFNRMLCDRSFRESVVDGNEIIERVIQRTAGSLDRALSDVNKGLNATAELTKYLDRLRPQWAKHGPAMVEIYDAMRGNAAGWTMCFEALQGKSEQLTKQMLKLATVTDEVAKRCGIASRRKTPHGVVGRRSHVSLHVKNASLPGPVAPTGQPTTTEKPLPVPPRRKSIKPPSRTASSSSESSTANLRTPSLVSVSRSGSTDKSTSPLPSVVEGDVSSPRSVSPLKSQLGSIKCMSTPALPLDTDTDLSYFPSPEAEPPIPLLAPPSPSLYAARSECLSRPATASRAESRQSQYLTPCGGPDRRSVAYSPLPFPDDTTPCEDETSSMIGLGIQQAIDDIHREIAAIDPKIVSGPTPLTPKPELQIPQPKGRRATNPARLESISVLIPPRAPSTSQTSPMSPMILGHTSHAHGLPTPTSAQGENTIPIVTVEPSDKMVVDTKNAPSDNIDSGYVSCWNSPTTHISDCEADQPLTSATLSAPFAPDDITPWGALRSHPISSDMIPPSPSTIKSYARSSVASCQSLSTIPTHPPKGRNSMPPLEILTSGPKRRTTLTSMKVYFLKRAAKKR